MTTTLGSDEGSSSLVKTLCSGGSSSDEGDGEGLLDNTEFIRNRKERSTVLVRRFFKNNQKVSPCKFLLLVMWLTVATVSEMTNVSRLFQHFIFLTVFLIYSLLQNNEKMLSFFQKMTKSVCAGTRAIVKTLPSGHISEEVWGVVDYHRIWRPNKKDICPNLRRCAREESGVCRDMRRLVGANQQQVREWTNKSVLKWQLKSFIIEI